MNRIFFAFFRVNSLFRIVYLFICLFMVFMFSLSLSGCNLFRPYKIPIQQGENFSQKKIKKLQPDMTKDQVLYLLGSPNASSPFDKNKWIYVYTNQHNYLPRSESKLVLTFNNDNKLINIEGDGAPPAKLSYKTVR